MVFTHDEGSSIVCYHEKHDGYPSGSMVDFASDADGSSILAVSRLVFHSKDLATNGKCSLLMARDPEDRTDLVITLHGDAILVSEIDKAYVRNAYLASHPNAFWVDFGDFQFLCIQPKVARYVSGVATALLGSGEFSNEEYKDAKVDPIVQFSKPVTHMKKDHANDTKVIVQHSTSIPVMRSIQLNLKENHFPSSFLCLLLMLSAFDNSRYSCALVSSVFTAFFTAAIFNFYVG
ncbi:uncharacterized protein LOC133779186 [Humulus lupulus]|uniref:uncharacterized protein LOC133779186 n=1 Tax=Humulus lupulus TaxID=3486 RepID=UPI002B409EC8|nr:uncharacterized protein LOC133779186 [Humulus lupulus]